MKLSKQITIVAVLAAAVSGCASWRDKARDKFTYHDDKPDYKVTENISPARSPEKIPGLYRDVDRGEYGYRDSSSARSRDVSSQSDSTTYQGSNGPNYGYYESGTQVAPTSSDRASSQISSDHIVLTFVSGSKDLDESSKAKLRQLVSSVGKDNIRRVEIASWSDKDFPQTGSDLPRDDQNLAQQRGEKIEDFLDDELDVSGFRTRIYNMAETSNWLARMFRTNEAELKSSFGKDADSSLGHNDFQTIRSNGGPCKAVVMLIRK